MVTFYFSTCRFGLRTDGPNVANSSSKAVDRPNLVLPRRKLPQQERLTQKPAPMANIVHLHLAQQWLHAPQLVPQSLSGVQPPSHQFQILFLQSALIVCKDQLDILWHTVKPQPILRAMVDRHLISQAWTAALTYLPCTHSSQLQVPRWVLLPLPPWVVISASPRHLSLPRDMELPALASHRWIA